MKASHTMSNLLQVDDKPEILNLSSSIPSRPRLRIPKPAESPARLALRVVAGLVFLTLGQMKFFDTILLGTDAVSLPPGPAGFAQYLGAIGIPFPLLNAYMVCLVEMICGLGLLLSAFLPYSAILTRLSALPLVIDMMVAIATVGLRNAQGNPVQIHGVAVTAQPWRLPLELSLFLLTLLFLWRPLPRRALAVAIAPAAPPLSP
jgi:uncharacterized membrane protein YphA (DoxX/SURF4 family)